MGMPSYLSMRSQRERYFFSSASLTSAMAALPRVMRMRASLAVVALKV